MSRYRKMYQERYHQIILRIETDAEEVNSVQFYLFLSLNCIPYILKFQIISLYSEVGDYIRTRTEAEHKREFEFERIRNAEARLKSLKHDIRELKIKIQTIEANFDVSNKQSKTQV